MSRQSLVHGFSCSRRLGISARFPRRNNSRPWCLNFWMAEDIRIVAVEIPGPAGMLEGIVNANPGSDPRAIAVLGHPLPTEGGTLHTKGVFHAAKGFARIGCAVLRFNFRGVGRSAGVFSGGPGEQDDFRAALDFMMGRYPEVNSVWAAGMSFGAWVA